MTSDPSDTKQDGISTNTAKETENSKESLQTRPDDFDLPRKLQISSSNAGTNSETFNPTSQRKLATNEVLNDEDSGLSSSRNGYTISDQAIRNGAPSMSKAVDRSNENGKSESVISSPSEVLQKSCPSEATTLGSPTVPGQPAELSYEEISVDPRNAGHTQEHTSVTKKPEEARLDRSSVDFKGIVNAQADTGPVAGHRRGQSSTSKGVSEWSHQQLAPHEVEEEKAEEDEWQAMPAVAPFDIYDDNNKLIARETCESDDEAVAYDGLGGAGKGYTRVQLDEDAQSATSMDDNTQYLFKDVNGTSAAGPEDDQERDALSQMQATKDLLTEGQRIAYVGMTRLALNAMLAQAEAMENITKGTKKEARLAAEVMRKWSQKMMVRLYAHMDISTAEQIMIEQLAQHGVEPRDLTPTLMQNARVKNPMAEKEPRTSSLASPRPSSIVENESRASISSAHSNEEQPAPAPPAYKEYEGNDLPEVRTPSQLPTSENIDIDLRWTVLCDLFLTLIADSIYDARARVLLENVGDHMDVPWTDICRFEKRVTDALEMQQAAEKENWNEDGHKENRRKLALRKRYMMMGLATVGGGLVIGLSAGLLAPLIGAGLAAGFTTIGVAGTSGFLAGAGGAAIITSTAAASGGIIAVRAANRRTGAVKTFEYRPLHNNKRVNLIVTVSGWMTGKVDDVRLPYSTVDPVMGDMYSVLWEPEMLTSMGDTINILATEALTQGLQQVLGSTILIGLMAALQLPVVLTKLSYLIDNPWTVSLDRANAAGLILADSLIDRNLGTRPITLVGYSLGSRLIFSCLKELVRRGAFGLVQNVYLFGSPIVANRDEYLKARTVVAGRFVNGYATHDWILAYLFRLTSGGISRVAGIAPVEDIPRLENVNVTDLVPGHMQYRTAMPRLLREVGWLVESDEFTEIEDPDPENHEKRQRELINEIEEARKDFENKEKDKGFRSAFGFFARKKKMSKKEWETYQESSGEKEEKGESSNENGVLFDVDAIRRELAKEQMEVKELTSTLPPMKLDLNSSKEPTTDLSVTEMDLASPRELKSTLPPMRLDLSAPTDASISPRPVVRETKSYDLGSMINDSKGGIKHSQHTQSLERGRLSDVSNHPNPELSNLFPLPGDEYQSSLDTSFRPPSFTASSLVEPSPNPFGSPPIAEARDRAATVQRPELKSSVTLPAMGLGAGMALDHNAWADDDDEFREQEMEMSFA